MSGGLKLDVFFCLKEDGVLQGTGHYLSRGGGDHLIFRRTKGGSVITHENPKGRIAENFGRIQRGDHSNVLGK